MATAPGQAARFVADLDLVTERVQRHFGRLTAAQLSWQPAAGEWSIAQCLQHLILINASYFPVLERLARGEWRPTWKERVPVLPALFGRLVLSAVQPDATRKFKARPAFEPASGGIGGDIVERFAAHQRELARHIVATADRDWSTVVITSPVFGVMTYRLPDAYRIIVTHEQHHCAQAERVLAAPGFERSGAGGQGSGPVEAAPPPA
jgi:hypothetical protein